MQDIFVTLFGNATPKGKELASHMREAFAQDPVPGFKINFQIVYEGNQGDMLIAGLRDDIVIFDGSVEDDIGRNYQAAHMWPSTMKHFLVISRTRLPLNFTPYHKGGTPDTAEVAKEPLYTLDNEYLIQWVVEKINLLSPGLPRPSGERIEIAEGEFFSKRGEILQIAEGIIAKSTDERKQFQKEEGRAFVSYLSRYSRFHHPPPTNHPTVEDVNSYIKQTHGNPGYPVLYYPPGTLSGEFMTEHRRWQVLSIIDWRIRSADEFWIFETEDYYNSWWTLAELAALAYIHHYEPEAVPKIILYRPTTDGWKHQEAPPNFIQLLNEKAARGYGRRLSNSDPLTGGYETIKKQREIARKPLVMQWVVFQGAKILGNIMMNRSPMYQKLKQEEKSRAGLGTFRHYREMLKSPVYTDSFIHDRIVSCPHCTPDNVAKHRFDFQHFLFNRLPGQYRLTVGQSEPALDSGTWACPVCGHRYQIVSHQHPQYIWWPIRGGRPTGPEGRFVESLPMYELRRE